MGPPGPARQRQADLVSETAVPDLAALAPALEATVLAAGEIAMAAFGRGGRAWEKSPGQVLTETDLAVDRALQQHLHHLFPDAAWLSEESLDDGRRLQHRHVWVVDPIDGTRSFAKGLPEFTISVALVEDGVPVLACLLNPATGELFQARRGHGASLNGRRLDMSEPDDPGRARIVLSATERKTRNFNALFPNARLTTIGSLAYKMALVAAGRFDAYFSWRGSHDWDIAAALLVLEEAGGKTTDRSGNKLVLNREEPRHRGVIAASPELHQALTALSRRHLEGAGFNDPGLQLEAASR